MTTTAPALTWTEPTMELPDMADRFPAPPAGVDTDPAPAPARRKPGPPKGSPQRGGRRTGGEAAAAPARKATPNKPTPAAVDAKDYKQGVIDLIAPVQGVLAGVGMLPGKDVYLADAAVLSMLAPPLGDAAAQFAATNPNHQMVGWLDKAITVGPYAMFGTAIVTGLAQIAVNHGLLPAGMLGTKSPRLLALTMKARMMAAAEQMAAQQAQEQQLIDALIGDQDDANIAA